MRTDAKPESKKACAEQAQSALPHYVIQDLFRVVGRLDAQALRPLAVVLGEERGVAAAA